LTKIAGFGSASQVWIRGSVRIRNTARKDKSWTNQLMLLSVPLSYLAPG